MPITINKRICCWLSLSFDLNSAVPIANEHTIDVIHGKDSSKDKNNAAPDKTKV